MLLSLNIAVRQSIAMSRKIMLPSVSLFNHKCQSFITIDHTAEETLNLNSYETDFKANYEQPSPNEKFSLPKNMKYEKLKEMDKRFGPVITTAKSRKLREKRQLILLEGKLLIKTALAYGIKVKTIYFTKVEHLEGIPLEDTDIQLYKVHYSNMKLFSDVSTPPGIMAICSLPEMKISNVESYQNIRILILDNIRDPGNMGTLLRSASGAGFHLVIAMKGCVDIWEPKVLRASAGATFSLVSLNNVDWTMLRNYVPDNMKMFIADNEVIDNSKADDDNQVIVKQTSKMNDSLSHEIFNNVDYTNQPIGVYIGGETHGISNEALKFSRRYNGQYISIPLRNSIESLNAGIAGSIIMFEIQRQIREFTSSS